MKPIDTFQNRLQKAINIRNIKPVELHERTEISESLLSKYLSGNAVARQRKLALLADALNVNEVWLMGYDVSMEKISKIDELGNLVVSIDLLGTIKAGYDWVANEEKIGTVDIPAELAKTGDFFALKVKGDSMADAILDGDTVIIRKQDFAEEGNIVAALINGDEVTLKMFRTTENGIKLMPLNRRIDPITGQPLHEDLLFTKEEIEKKPVTIIGVLKKQEREW